METGTITDMLREHGIRPSYQRVRILSFLQQKEGHSTVDEIYRALIVEIPTLSRATVYNTLHVFVQAGIACSLQINGEEIRFDPVLSTHGHFVCEVCGSITNFPVDIDRLQIGELARYQIRARNVTFNGICPDCLARIR